MSLLSWLFPSEKDRIRKGRELLERGDPAAARLQLLGATTGEGLALRREAERALVLQHLEAARAEVEAGELESAAEHVELATRFADGEFRRELRAARRELREARSARKARASSSGLKIDPFKALAPVDLLRSGEPGPEMPSPGFGADPLFSLPPDHPRVRYALLLESYPDVLRERCEALGEDFARAVMLIEDGQPARAAEALAPFVEQDPVARYERARAWLAARQFARAASDLRAFGDALGHHRIGPEHTAGLLAQALAAQRRLDEALEVIEAAREREPGDLQLAGLQVSILEGLGRLEEADRLGSWLARRAPREMGVYKLLARIRLRAGRRVEAMQALEAGLQRICTTPGKCGSQPLDLDAARLLARLYLEDRLEPRRADELIAEIEAARKQPDWSDGYLLALRARNRGEPGALEQARVLYRQLPPGAPLRALLREQFSELGELD